MASGAPIHDGDQLAYTVTDAGRVLGVSRRTLYELMDSGELGSIKIRSRRLVPRSELERYVAERLAAAREDR